MKTDTMTNAAFHSLGTQAHETWPHKNQIKYVCVFYSVLRC